MKYYSCDGQTNNTALFCIFSSIQLKLIEPKKISSDAYWVKLGIKARLNAFSYQNFVWRHMIFSSSQFQQRARTVVMLITFNDRFQDLNIFSEAF